MTKIRCIVCTEAPELEYVSEMEFGVGERKTLIENGELRCPVCTKEYWVGG